MRFRVTYVVDTELCVEDVWPDGDAPEHPNAEDVMELLKTWPTNPPSSTLDTVSDWHLADDAILTVTDGNGYVAEWREADSRESDK